MNSRSTMDVFAGFWGRVGAFLLDVLLIGLAGVAAGYFLVDTLVQIGVWGRLVGFVFAGCYFGALNSRIGDGQTIGKRILGIRVVGRDGRPLPLPASLLRYAVLGTPWFLNGAQFPMDWLMSPLLYLLALLIFGVALASGYLLIFNRPSRQSLHDLLAGSYVVRADSAGAVAAGAPARVHLIVVGVLMAICTALPLISKVLMNQEPFAGLLAAYQSASAEPTVYNVQVSKGWTASAGETRTTYVSIEAAIHDRGVDDAERAGRLARRVLEADPSMRNVDVVQVVLVYGYDIGIASYSRSQAHSRSPAAWLVNE